MENGANDHSGYWYQCGMCGSRGAVPTPCLAVDTFIGLVRLCDECGVKDPYARRVTPEQWKDGAVTPAVWRQPNPAKRRRRRAAR